MGDGNAPPGGGGASGGANERSPSTPSDWEWRRVRRRRRPPAEQVPKGRRWAGRVPWPRRKPLGIRIWWRGGPEAWVAVEARGETNYFPGHTSIVDVFETIWRDD